MWYYFLHLIWEQMEAIKKILRQENILTICLFFRWLQKSWISFYLVTLCYKELHSILYSGSYRSAYFTETMILFLKWLYFVQGACLGYQNNVLPFQNPQTQVNLTKELNHKRCSSPRSICMSRRSEEDTLKCLQKW